MAWKIVNEAMRLGAPASRRATSKKNRPVSKRARGGNRTLGPIVQRADELIDRSLGLLQKFIDVEATMERLSLIGSAYKRSALIAAAADKQDRVEQALKEMKSAYRRAQQFGETHGSDEVYYPAANCLVADVAADAGKRRFTLDPKTVAVVRTSLASRNEADSDFWSVAGLIELDQYEALASGALASAFPLLGKAYQDLTRVCSRRKCGCRCTTMPPLSSRSTPNGWPGPNAPPPRRCSRHCVSLRAPAHELIKGAHVPRGTPPSRCKWRTARD